MAFGLARVRGMQDLAVLDGAMFVGGSRGDHGTITTIKFDSITTPNSSGDISGFRLTPRVSEALEYFEFVVSGIGGGGAAITCACYEADCTTNGTLGALIKAVDMGTISGGGWKTADFTGGGSDLTANKSYYIVLYSTDATAFDNVIVERGYSLGGRESYANYGTSGKPNFLDRTKLHSGVATCETQTYGLPYTGATTLSGSATLWRGHRFKLSENAKIVGIILAKDQVPAAVVDQEVDLLADSTAPGGTSIKTWTLEDDGTGASIAWGDFSFLESDWVQVVGGTWYRLVWRANVTWPQFDIQDAARSKAALPLGGNIYKTIDDGASGWTDTDTTIFSGGIYFYFTSSGLLVHPGTSGGARG